MSFEDTLASIDRNWGAILITVSSIILLGPSIGGTGLFWWEVTRDWVIDTLEEEE